MAKLEKSTFLIKNSSGDETSDAFDMEGGKMALFIAADSWDTAVVTFEVSTADFPAWIPLLKNETEAVEIARNGSVSLLDLENGAQFRIKVTGTGSNINVLAV